MAISLCVPPRRGELCAPVRFTLTSDRMVFELTARHLVRKVELDAGDVVVCIDITDPSTSRPVHVRFELVGPGSDHGPRSVLLGRIERAGESLDVLGTYLGVVSEEN